VQIAPSCSLLHVPIDVELEDALDPDLKSWLAFANQKMSELVTLGTALAGGRAAVQATLAASSACRERAGVRRRCTMPPSLPVPRPSPPTWPAQEPLRDPLPDPAAGFSLPAFPTTTIGSFPQTADVRKARQRMP
jgi:5-methyltetrahydropteroyltriglutamate--homocysteine methyltransferase